MCIYYIAICYLYVTTIIIICMYLPLYIAIFHLSILHIPNSILPKNTHCIAYNLEDPDICKCMHFYISTMGIYIYKNNFKNYEFEKGSSD